MDDKMEKPPIMKRLPITFGSFLTSLLIIIFGVGMRGEWILVAVNILRQYEESTRTSLISSTAYFQDLPYFLASSVLTSFGIYFGLGGFLQWHFYIKQRDNSEDWKCQPNKFLSSKDERHEILLGSANMVIGSTISGLLSCYLMNGGKGTSFYYRFDEHGWTYLLLSIPILFMYQDAAAYYVHRTLHLPFFYKNFHKMHHRYKQPTAFSATAMHPCEFLFFQTFLALPLFGPPIHWAVYTGILLYIYYFGLMDHSGIDMKHIWPWQPNTIFHDDHHKYFHVNFGFNTFFFDKLHNTARDPKKFYSEKVFYGYGKSMNELSKEEREEMEKED